ncbi:hypothetical protein BKA70DRAFT_542655 [Coprinopsis sp. MPI-PUGE-AT-0042]|nr:hypothetical protein BKA70DRAFT_542655 [Coprinopsis sp. MPI-PUGE-AT-0042]
MAQNLTRNVEQEYSVVGTSGATGNDALSPRTTAMFSNAHNFQIANSTLSVAGRDHVVHNHYSQYERSRDIWAILQSIPNFRRIYHDMLSKATAGTGMWLVKGDKFRIWLEPNGNIKIFWGSGIRKSGIHPQ